MTDREHSAALERALRWISDRLLAEPDAARAALLDEAARRFDLSPRDAEFLLEAYRERERGSGEDA